MSPFLSLPKVTVTNWPYYKSSFQCSYILSLAGLPEDFCELVSKIYFTEPKLLCGTTATTAAPSASARPKQHMQSWHHSSALLPHLPNTCALCLLHAPGSSAASEILKAHCYLVSISTVLGKLANKQDLQHNPRLTGWAGLCASCPSVTW